MTTRTFSTLVYCLATALPCLFACGRANLGSEQAVGRPCNLGITAGPSEAAFNASAAECPTKLCLQPAVDRSASMPAPNTTAICTGECVRDSDCDGETRDQSNPLDTRCSKGFSCGIPYEVGPLACKKLCVCKDFLGPAGAATPITCQGGSTTPIAAKPTGTGETTVAFVSQSRSPQLDIVAMIDNTATMAPKVAKFTAQFPKLLEALRSPTDGTLPDLHLAILDSDLGTAGIHASGPCGPKLVGGTQSLFGDLGRFQMLSTPTACTVAPGATFLETRAGLPLNFTGDTSTVFSCLVGNLGTAGCGYAHQLQTFEFGLVAGGIGNDSQRAAFVRPYAQLGLIFLTDQDDCSAATNDGMFADTPGLAGEAPWLRCATRAHACAGVNLANGSPGYPTTSSYLRAFSECAARTDTCPNPTDGDPNFQTDTSSPTSCSPLKSVRRLADELKNLKGRPEEQLLVAGIFGWPRSATDMTTAAYQIAPVPNPNPADTAHPTVFDLWPVCYDPNHLPTPATTDPVTGFDSTAAAWGATGGLRESAFIDEFGESGLKFSICEPDFGAIMTNIGSALARKMDNRCFERKLRDIDPVADGVQSDCRVTFLTPIAPDTGGIVYLEDAIALPQCPYGATDGTVAVDCWQVVNAPAECPVTGQRVSVLRTAAEIAAGPLPAGTKVKMQCQTCPEAATAVAGGCEY
jgi:hypothetical protein